MKTKTQADNIAPGECFKFLGQLFVMTDRRKMRLGFDGLLALMKDGSQTTEIVFADDCEVDRIEEDPSRN